MAKPNKRHHELCLRYKQEGRREKNKKIRAERNERRIARFAAKRAKKEKEAWDGIPKDPETRGSNRQEPMGDSFYRPRMEHMTPYQRMTSALRRIRNVRDREEYEAKHGKAMEGKKKE